MRKAMLVVVAVILQVVTSRPSEARVVRFIVEQTRTFAEGKSFGDVGPYLRLDGTVVMEVDPRDPLNAVIVNLDKAPRNAKGMVEFSAPFFILKPIDMTRGNQKIFYGVNNRGNKIEYAWRTALPQSLINRNNPLTAADAGDGLLLRMGYTYVDAGWQGDVAAGNDRLAPNLPVAMGANGQPIVAKMRVIRTIWLQIARAVPTSAPTDRRPRHVSSDHRSQLDRWRTNPGRAGSLEPGRCARGRGLRVDDHRHLSPRWL